MPNLSGIVSASAEDSSGIDPASGEDLSGIEPVSGEDESGEDTSGIESDSGAGMFWFISLISFECYLSFWRCRYLNLDFAVIETRKKPSKNQVCKVSKGIA